MKVGIMGGTFDPIHLAHLIIAEEARYKLGLDRVVFIPANHPWMKSDHEIASTDHRLAMVKLAIDANHSFDVSSIELERSGPTYTVDTLEQLWKELGYAASMYLLVGWDSLRDMPKWKAPLRISKMATIVTFPRPGYEKPDITSLEADIPNLSERLVMLDEPFIGISSTAVRRKIAAGESIRYLVPEAVRQYIVDNRLYRSS